MFKKKNKDRSIIIKLLTDKIAKLENNIDDLKELVLAHDDTIKDLLLQNSALAELNMKLAKIISNEGLDIGNGAIEPIEEKDIN